MKALIGGGARYWPRFQQSDGPPCGLLDRHHMAAFDVENRGATGRQQGKPQSFANQRNGRAHVGDFPGRRRIHVQVPQRGIGQWANAGIWRKGDIGQCSGNADRREHGLRYQSCRPERLPGPCPGRGGITQAHRLYLLLGLRREPDHAGVRRGVRRGDRRRAGLICHRAARIISLGR